MAQNIKLPAPVVDPELAADLARIRGLHGVYVAKAKARGVRFLAYTMPCCGNQAESAAGPAEGQWDTLAGCVHCGTMYMKISTADKITVALLDDLAREEAAAPGSDA